MVVMVTKLAVCYSIFSLCSLAVASLIENVINDLDPCEEVCQKTYPLHTYDRSVPGSCCSRGCRLYSIIELIGGDGDANGTLNSCFDNCKDAYPVRAEETSACTLGCSSQKPFTEKWGHFDMDSPLQPWGMPRMMYPLLYMHSLYSSMVNKVTQHMSISWSFVMRDGSGRLVIMKSQPPASDMDIQDLGDYSAFVGTSSVIETNIEPSDNTATHDLRHSQLKSATGNEINAAEASPWTHKMVDGSNSDWLSCISNKSGVPRLLLSVFILLSAVALIWLCMSAAATAPDHRLPQKLSIISNLDYLHSLPGKKGILPQDVAEALPVKLSMEQV